MIPAACHFLESVLGPSSTTLAYIGPGAGFTFLSSFFVLFAAIALLMLSLATWPIRIVLQWIPRLRTV